MQDIKLRVHTNRVPRMMPSSISGRKRCRLKCAAAKTTELRNTERPMGKYFAKDGRRKPLKMACACTHK